MKFTILKSSLKSCKYFLSRFSFDFPNRISETKNVFKLKLIISAVLMLLSSFGYSQEKQKDTTKLQLLDEVLVTAVRVNATSPITHSNIDKKQLEKRNLGQDIPILLNYLPSVVTTTDAGAGVGYTGIRVRGINAQSTNITINGIPYNDAK